MTDTEGAEDLAILVNTPAQTESQLYSLEPIAGGIGLYMMQIEQSSCLLNRKKTSPL